MADAKALPVFAFTEDRVQMQQLRAYLKQHGAEIDEQGPTDLCENLLGLVRGVSVIGDLDSDKEAEMILTSVCSLFVAVPSEIAVVAVDEFCKQISSDKFQGIGWASNVGAAVRVLSNLFYGFNKHPRVQHILFIALVKLCGRARLIADLDTNIEQINEYVKKWSLNTQQHRSLLRLIHGALINDHRADSAAKIMTALLGTYTDKDASSAIDDARECVRTAIVDPKSFSFDHLLRLSAVKLLQKSDPVMFEILKLFNEGTLSDYRAFIAKHPDFVQQKLHVDEEVLVQKMRLLTLMSMAEKSNVIALKDISKQVDIAEGEDLEEFIIEAIQINAITGKINEMKKELIVSSLQHRSFGRPQWELLHKRLVGLITNVQNTRDNLKSVHPLDEIA